MPTEGPRAAGPYPETLARHPGLCGGSGLDPAGMRVSPPSSPRRAGGWMRPPAAAGCLEGSWQGPCGRGSSRARPDRGGRGSEGPTWARLCRCLGWRGCGRCRLSMEGGLRAAEQFAATGSTNGSHTGAGSRVLAPLGRTHL